MAGHLVLYNIKLADLKLLKDNVGATTSTLMHPPDEFMTGTTTHYNWNEDDILKATLNYQQGAKDYATLGRTKLPPHFYIQFPLLTSPTSKEQIYLGTCSWISNLQWTAKLKPRIINATITDLCKAGRIREAFLSGIGITQGFTIEVYRVNGVMCDKSTLFPQYNNIV